LSPWDIAAGSLLVQEAGGIISNLNGKEGWLQSGNILAASPKIYDAMLEVLAPHLTEEIKA
jgi:myo-inositol-1(or 4)-monophosphatase